MPESQHNALIQAIKRRQKHIRPWARRHNITCFRLYDADQSDIPVEIDMYGNLLHVSEIEKPHTGSSVLGPEWLADAAAVAGATLGIPHERIFRKFRPTRKGGTAPEHRSSRGATVTAWVQESELDFKINLTDYLDTGLFLHHRITRGMVADLALDRSVLNLFSYTGAFTVYAAAGGARSTTSVDMSNTYNDWAKENYEANGVIGEMHTTVGDDVLSFLAHERRRDARYDLIVLDPPTFSNSNRMDEVFDVRRDHPKLINTCLSLLSTDGVLVFCTNARKFHLNSRLIEHKRPVSVTDETTSEDFAYSRPHRAWLLSKAEATQYSGRGDNASSRPAKGAARRQSRRRR